MSTIEIPEFARSAAIAAAWLANHASAPDTANMARTGFVVIYGGKACGWTHSMEGKPSAWRPGCVAVNVQIPERIYLAAGGNYWDGAEEWRLIRSADVVSAALGLVAWP